MTSTYKFRFSAKNLLENVRDSEAHIQWLYPSGAYIVMEKRLERSLKMMEDLISAGVPGYVISRKHPEKIRKICNLPIAHTMWLSQLEVEYAIKPNDFWKIEYIIENFTAQNEESAVMLDGVEYLMAYNGTHKVIECISRLKDTMSRGKSWLIISLLENKLSIPDLKRVKGDFHVV